MFHLCLMTEVGSLEGKHGGGNSHADVILPAISRQEIFAFLSNPAFLLRKHLLPPY